MKNCTAATLGLATLLSSFGVGLMKRINSPLGEIAELIRDFHRSDPTPTSTHEFEKQLQIRLRQLGRAILEWLLNHIEPESSREMPPWILFQGEYYSRSLSKTPNRYLSTVFGTITLWRYWYRPEVAGAGIFPLEIKLGLECGLATPALAERVAQYTVDSTQQTVLKLLREDHGVKWSVASLRKVISTVSLAMTQHAPAAQKAKLLEWLAQAEKSRGRHRPTLSVGRDGIFVPIRKESCYREAATATISVLDRAGKRIGTIYLGRMPEEGQPTLSCQLTSLLEVVLKDWTGSLPRLVYVTDAGHHPREYFDTVLSRMINPRDPRRYLEWTWIVDYYHACQYISQLAESIFGPGRDAQAWAAKMRKWLKTKSGGTNRVLHSAAALRKIRGLEGLQKDYVKAYNYLHKHMHFMDYVRYRRKRLPIGSGITEAACKIVFTQRLKQSGMSWCKSGGQLVIDLRTIHLSQIWDAVRDDYLKDKPLVTTPTQGNIFVCSAQNAA